MAEGEKGYKAREYNSTTRVQELILRRLTTLHGQCVCQPVSYGQKEMMAFTSLICSADRVCVWLISLEVDRHAGQRTRQLGGALGKEEVDTAKGKKDQK